MESVARFSPFGPEGMARFDWTAGMSLATIVRRAINAIEKVTGAIGDYEWFFKHGIIRVGAQEFNREMWPYIKPKAGMVVYLLPPAPQKGKIGRIALILAAVALTAATGFIAAGGLAGALGAGTLAAGSLSANLLAGVVGLAGSWAIRTLTPPPQLNNNPDAVNRELSAAGVSGNAVTPGEYLISVIGRMRVSPQILIPSYTTLEDDRVYAHAMFGVQGRCRIEDVRLNNISVSEFADLELDVFEGDNDRKDSKLSLRTVTTDASGITLSNVELENEAGQFDNLKNQIEPEKSLPKWHPIKKKAGATETWIRLLFEGGITLGTTGYSLPIRIEVKRKGTNVWRRMPTFHIKDTKASGPFRREIKLIWGRPPPGKMVPANRALDIWMALYRTAVGQPFQYDADPYFDQVPVINSIPAMTGPTMGSAVVTTSSEVAGSEAWKAVDGNNVTTWAATLGVFPSYMQIDLGAGNSKYARSVGVFAFGVEKPSSFEITMSDDGVTWERLHLEAVPAEDWCMRQVDSKKAWRYFRLITLGAASPGNYVNINTFVISELDAPSNYVVGRFYASRVHLSYSGASVYLDPATWPQDEYDIRVKRGWAYETGALNTPTIASEAYEYLGNGSAAYFFDYDPSLPDNRKLVITAQKTIQSKTVIETVQHVFPQRPIKPEIEYGTSRFACRIPDIRIESASALLTGYAREFDATTGTWNDIPTPTRRAAPYYRDALLLASKNMEPLPGEVMDENSLEAASNWAVLNDFKCDTLIHNRRVPEVLDLLASSMRCSRRQADMWGLVIDKPRTGETPSGLITPETSKNLGSEINFDTIPHAFRVSFLDETDDYKEHNVTIYRTPFTADTATMIETQTDPVHTVESEVVAAWNYNMKQLVWRNRRYKYEVGFDGRFYARGDLIEVADETWQRDSYYGWIKRVIVSGANVTGFETHGEIRLSDSASEFSMASDVNAVADVNTFTGVFGAAIRTRFGQIITAPIINASNTSTVTMATPIASTGQFVENQPIAIGPMTREARRLILHDKKKSGEESWNLVLLPEATEVHL